MTRYILIPALLSLAACTSPRDACIADASGDLNTVRALIVDTEATINRGFAIQTEERAIIYTDFCFGTGRRGGAFTFCNRVQPVISRTPVAVDIALERRKLAGLRSKEAELRRSTANAVQRCQLSFPKG